MKLPDKSLVVAPEISSLAESDRNVKTFDFSDLYPVDPRLKLASELDIWRSDFGSCQ